jgi:similar to stage IV sporulation protein
MEKICRELGTEYEILEIKGAYRLLKRVAGRSGLIAGAVMCAVFMLIIRNFVVAIDILSDDTQIQKDIMNVLSDNKIGTGTYIPSIKCVKIERELKQKVSGISWAGISLTDSTLIIDVIENIPQPEKFSGRMPSNLVATHDAVVEDIELYNGRVVKTIGSGVVKGDVLVSGIVYRDRTKVEDGLLVTEKTEKYVRSIGKIYGTYTDTQTFEQPYSDTKLVVSDNTITKRYLSIFDTQIPLSIGSVNGLYTEDETYSSLKIFGNETPVGISTKKYTEYSFENAVYTKEQAKKQAEEKCTTYEENFLDDCEIKSKNVEVTYEKDKVVLAVTYELYGVISEESKFFIKK